MKRCLGAPEPMTAPQNPPDESWRLHQTNTEFS